MVENKVINFRPVWSGNALNNRRPKKCSANAGGTQMNAKSIIGIMNYAENRQNYPSNFFSGKTDVKNFFDAPLIPRLSATPISATFSGMLFG